MPSYAVLAEERSAEIRERGSIFFAMVVPTADEATAKTAIRRLESKFSQATHHCWAWRLGLPPSERVSDSGEPSGTAGLPILQVLRGAQISDVTAIVVRWFGGTKLGKGGLARAYSAATRAALVEVPIREAFSVERLELRLPYDQVGAVKRLLHPPEIELEGEEYGERALLRLRVRTESRVPLEVRLADLGIGAGQRGAIRILP